MHGTEMDPLQHAAGASAGGQAPGSVMVVACARHKDVDGTLYLPGQTYGMAQERVALNQRPHRHEDLVQAVGAETVDWWGAPGRILAAEPLEGEPVFSRAPAAGSLRILQGVGYDPGSAAYRFHSALNERTQHASIFARWDDTNPHCSLRQYDGESDARLLRQAMLEADVVHCHVNYLLIGNLGVGSRGLKVIHYHGSRPDGRSWVDQRQDDLEGAIQVGARLSHLVESPRLQWLPIAVPVGRYRELRTAYVKEFGAGQRLRVAHSPTKRALKGTDVFLGICERLRREGVPIEPVLIEGVSHANALCLKATCDAVFDSFWLGIQGSGLEGGAMGLPVVAGDPDVAALYQEHVGGVPYTYANDAAELAAVLERLAVDQAWRTAEAERVTRYVETVHDYPAVARRYEQLLSVALGRPEVITPAPEPATTPAPPPKRTPKRQPRETPAPQPVVTR